MNSQTRAAQESVCQRYGAATCECSDHLKVGISQNVRDGIMPVHGVRVKAAGDTTGWYIWAGEWSDRPDFFVPLHVRHLEQWCPAAIPFLLLPTGWRFLVAPEYEDVWFDPDVEPEGHSTP